MKPYLIIIILFTGQLLFSQERAIEGQSPLGRLSIRYQPPSVTMTANLQDGNGNQALDAEELKEGWTLACQAIALTSNVHLRFPD